LNAAMAQNDTIPWLRLSPGETLSTEPETVTWRKEEEKVLWPTDKVKIQDGGRYSMVPNFGPASRIEIRTIDKASVEGDQLVRVLNEKQCYDQIEAWLKTINPRS